MFKVPPSQTPYGGIISRFHQLQLPIEFHAGPVLSCSILKAENHISVIRAIMDHEIYLVEAFFDFEAEILTASSSVVWRYDLPLINQDILLAYAIAKGFMGDEQFIQLKAEDFISICQFIQALPKEHKTIGYIFRNDPILKSLYDREQLRFEEAQSSRRDQLQRDIKYEKDSISLNLLAFLCFCVSTSTYGSLHGSEISKTEEMQSLRLELWAIINDTDKDLTDVELDKCQRLIELTGANNVEMFDTYQNLKESLDNMKNIKSQPEPRHFIPLEAQVSSATVTYTQLASQFNIVLYNSARLINANDQYLTSEQSDDELTLSMSRSVELLIDTEEHDERLARYIAEDERQREHDRQMQFMYDEAVAKALQKEFEKEDAPVESMTLLKPLFGFFKSIYDAIQKPVEPEDPALLHTYTLEKREALIKEILSDPSYPMNIWGDIIDIDNYNPSLFQLKAYYAADAHVPEILGHLPKEQVLEIFRISKYHMPTEIKVRRFFETYNNGKDELPVSLRHSLHSIDGYGTYETDQQLREVMVNLFEVLSFEHVKSMHTLIAEKDHVYHVLYYLIRVAAIESIFE